MPNYFEETPVKQRKSGLLIPTTAEVSSVNEKIAEQYREEAISQASDFLSKKVMTPEEVASFLWTKSHSVDVIAEG